MMVLYRSRKINSGFERLRTVLPEVYQGRKLSKHETLMLAQVYIAQLADILQVRKMDSTLLNSRVRIMFSSTTERFEQPGIVKKFVL